MKMLYKIEIEFDYNELKSRYCKYHNESTFESWYEHVCDSPENLKHALDSYNCLYNITWRLQ